MKEILTSYNALWRRLESQRSKTVAVWKTIEETNQCHTVYLEKLLKLLSHYCYSEVSYCSERSASQIRKHKVIQVILKQWSKLENVKEMNLSFIQEERCSASTWKLSSSEISSLGKTRGLRVSFIIRYFGLNPKVTRWML